MKKENIIFFSGMVLMVAMVLGSSLHAKAAFEKPLEIKSRGAIVYDADDSGRAGDHPSDVVFDAEDIYYLYKLCE